jgi:hypothetical protein
MRPAQRPVRAVLPLLAAALLAWPAAPSAAVRMVDQVPFAEEVAAPGAPLLLTGTGVFRWKWIFKVYAVAHYLPGDSEGAGPASDLPRRLEFSYLVDIERSGFGKAADELLSRNFPPAALAPLRERLDLLHAAYVDVKPGDRYALTYQPGQGTELSYNGRPRAVIEGADFARAYFAIWLGEAPIDAGLRDRLLGR